jgi:hypothetical protein
MKSLKPSYLRYLETQIRLYILSMSGMLPRALYSNIHVTESLDTVTALQISHWDVCNTIFCPYSIFNGTEMSRDINFVNCVLDFIQLS